MFLIKDKEVDTMEAMKEDQLEEGTSHFIKWLEGELEKRGWQPYTLSQKAGLGNSTIGRILSGERNPGWDVCAAIAEPLGEQPVTIFRIAGLLPSAPGELKDLSEKEQKLVRLFRELRDHQDAFLSILEGMSIKYGNQNGK